MSASLSLPARPGQRPQYGRHRRAGTHRDRRTRHPAGASPQLRPARRRLIGQHRNPDQRASGRRLRRRHRRARPGAGRHHHPINPAAADTAQVAAITATQSPTLVEADVAVTIPSLAATVATQAVTGTTSTALAALNSQQAAGLSAIQINATGSAALAAASTQTVASLTDAQLAALTAAQVAALTPLQVAALTPEQRAIVFA